MLRHTKIAFVVAAAVLTSRCETPSNPSTKPPPKASLEASQLGALAARSVARAMAEPTVRQQILADMRDSPVSEHKLVLQDYFATASGQQVLSAIERAGIDADQLRSAVQGAGRIQFYLPNTGQRSTWRGSPAVLVAAFLTNEPPSVGFAPTGEPVPVELGKGKMPSGIEALFILEWAEPMFNRWSGPTAATETIQLPDESQIGSGRIVQDENGHIISTTDDTPLGLSNGLATEFANVEASATANEPSGTYLTKLHLDRDVCDPACIGEHLEFVFKSKASDNANTYVSAELSGISTSAGTTWVGWWQVHTSRALGSVNMEVQVYEADGTSNDDPFYCIAQDPHCSPSTSNWPYLVDPQVGPNPSWPFNLCEGDPNGCVDLQGNLHPAIDVIFRDRSTPVPTTVSVSPQTVTINKSATYPFTAQVTDQYGDLMTNQVAAWSSQNTGIATVVSTGNMTATATGVGRGQVAITATVGSASRGATLIVLGPATLTVSPSSAPMCAGQNTILTATVKDQNGGVWTGGTVGWSSSNTSVATVSSTGSRTGKAVAVGNGQGTITATLDGVQGQTSIPVAPCLPAPTSCTLDYIPQPHYLKVAWHNSDATASTQVDILRDGGDWQTVGTDAPGVAQHFYVVSSGLYYARVRHVKSGYTSSSYCNTNAKTVP